MTLTMMEWERRCYVENNMAKCRAIWKQVGRISRSVDTVTETKNVNGDTVYLVTKALSNL